MINMFSPIGVRHDGMKCSGCSQKPIYGMRWHCLNCINAFNLCTSCYMSDEHEKNHCFERIDKHGMSGYDVVICIYIYVPQVTVSKYFSNNSNVKKKKNSDNNVNNTA